MPKSVKTYEGPHGGLLGRLGGLLEASWAVFVDLESISGASWAASDASPGHRVRSWDHLGRLGS
eukprot:9228734-Pyramimonas_sp.AAC.1